MDGNKLTLLHPDLFKNKRELNNVYVNDNLISNIHPSTFEHNIELRYLDISKNQITSVHPDTFIYNNKLKFVYLQGNNITEISNSTFQRLPQLEELDLSNNNIEELNPHVFHNSSPDGTRYSSGVPNLKLLNLAQNVIRYLNFESCFPISSNSYGPYTSEPKTPLSQLECLNVSSNRLTTLDVASMQWLNHTTAVTALTATPWNCNCAVLLEVWRGLKHKLTLQCASPRELEGKSWDVMEEFCSQPDEDRNYTSNTSPEAVSPSAGYKEESELSPMVEGPSVVTIALIVTGVLLLCAIGGGLILATVVKRRRNKPATPKHDDVYASRESHISLNSLYEYTAPGPSHVVDQSNADSGNRPSCLSVQH
jgi:hypothetical protein